MRYRPEVIQSELKRRYFERSVDRTVRSLPRHLHQRLDNLDIVVEDEPADGAAVYGLYEGVPLIYRTHDYGMTVPDRVTIYRGPLERDFPATTDLLREIRITVLHELAHHFGLDEFQLEEKGY